MRRVATLAAAVLVLAGGAIHFDLWRQGYRGVPNIGPLFLANALSSVGVATAIVLRSGRLALLAGVGLAAGTLAGLVISRTVGLLGFLETSWTPDAMRTVAAEVGALVSLSLVGVIRGRSDHAVLVSTSDR